MYKLRIVGEMLFIVGVLACAAYCLFVLASASPGFIKGLVNHLMGGVL
jgi:hypothetical protein